MEKLVARLQGLEPAGVILGATGGLELTLAAALAAASLPLPRPPANWPRTTDSTPRSWPTLERLSIRACADADTQVFGAMLARRRQVVAILVAENNRLGRALRAVRPRVEAHIAWLKQELSELDGELSQTILSSPVWREKDELLRSVPGVGNQVSMTLLADLPELGSLGRSKSQLWSAWPHPVGIADAKEGGVLPGVDGPECGLCCTWEPWWRHAETQSAQKGVGGHPGGAIQAGLGPWLRRVLPWDCDGTRLVSTDLDVPQYHPQPD